MRSKAFPIRLSAFVASLVALLWGYRLMWGDHAPTAFRSPEEDMSYAWFVPLFSLYVLWCERARIFRSLGGFSWGGVPTLLLSLAVGFLGIRGHQLRFEIVGFAGLLASLAWTFFGRDTARRVLFPAAFLLFCIPIVGFLDAFTVHLRLLAVSVSYGVLKGIGADVVRQGTMILSSSGTFAIDVAAPCSGLRSLMAMAALSAGYAYFTQPTWLRRGALFLCSLPIAIIGNVVRILLIVLVGECASASFATGFYHDYSGYAVFLVAIGLMLATGEAITRLSSRRGAKAPPEKGGETPASVRRPEAGLAATLAVAALFCAAMAVQGLTGEPVLAEAPQVRLGEIAGFASEPGAIAEAELATLPKDTVIVRREYADDFGRRFTVSAVVGGRSKSSIHRPELCLPAQGFEMSAPRTVEVGGVAWRLLTIRRGLAAPAQYAYTFFNQEGFRTSSHLARIFRDVWDRSILNRIDRWVMVTVECRMADDAAFAAFAGKLEEVLK